MLIGGYTPLSLSDFPGRPAAIIFTQGCNLRCPFCHNPSLLPARVSKGLDAGLVLDRLAATRNRISAVVLSGGEPTIQADILQFLGKLRELDFKIKLDTNGTRPGIIRAAVENGLVDFIAMDVKAPWDRYAQLCGVTIDVGSIRESVDVVGRCSIPHMFRTTVVPALLDASDVDRIRAMLPDDQCLNVQRFRPEHALDPALRGVPAPADFPPG